MQNIAIPKDSDIASLIVNNVADQPDSINATSFSPSDERKGDQSIATQCGPVNIETPASDFSEESKELSPLERVQMILRGLSLVLAHHGVPQPVMDSFKNQVTDYLLVEDESVFFKRAKYLTVAPMARYLKCESPKKPDLDFIPRGAWKKWSHQRLRVFSRKNTHLWYSFLQAKRAAAPLSDELVLATYEEHRVAMGRPDPIDPETHDVVMKELEPVLNKIRKQVQRTLGTDVEGRPYVEAEHVASTRACFQKSRAKGGQLGELTTIVPEICFANPLSSADVRIKPDLVSMKFYPKVVVNGVVRYNLTISEFSYVDLNVVWKKRLTSMIDQFQDRVYQRPLYHDGDRYIITTTRHRRLRCTIQAVLEPLKVRVISKGEAVPYYLSKSLQVAIHSVMRQMDCFRLIGRPLCPTDLIDLRDNPVEGGEGEFEWNSIDYSAATDKLSARLSRSILLSIIRDFEPRRKSMYRAVLAPHLCKYPFPFNEKVPDINQENGQLMGSILSFPILCLANLGLYLANIRDDPRRLRLKLKGVLVNGDDMLYVARSSRWATHVSLGERVGLTMSPGKAYHHPVYANANSACFHMDLRIPGSTPYSVPFLNTGLYFAQSKVLGGTDVEINEGRISTIDRLLQGSLPGKQCEVLKGFLSRNGDAIRSEARGRNLFIPEQLGGMGVELPLGWKTDVTMAQRLVASRLWRENPHLVSGHGPNIGSPLPSSELDSVRSPWIAGLDFKSPANPEVPVRDEQRLRCTYAESRDRRTHIHGLLPNSRIFLPVSISPIPRNTKFAPRALSSPLEVKYQRERFEAIATDSFTLNAELLDVSPWHRAGRSLDCEIDLFLLESGSLHLEGLC